MKFIDISNHNTGEAIYSSAGKYIKTIPHDFDWSKAKAQGVEGAIIKSSESIYDDMSYEIVMRSCSLAYKGIYHFVGYTQKYYAINHELDYADDQTQKIISQVDKFRSKINLKIALDYEQNSKWEQLKNTNEDMVINRANKILLRICTNIYKNEGYWPIIYTNRNLTSILNKNFVNCPLWIALGFDGGITYNTSAKPKSDQINYWSVASIRQVSWTGNGALYGNYTGNPYIDINVVDHLENIVIGAPQSEDEVVYHKGKVVALWGVKVRTSPEVANNDTNNRYAYGTVITYTETQYDNKGNKWVKTPLGWSCAKYGKYTYIKEV